MNWIFSLRILKYKTNFSEILLIQAFKGLTNVSNRNKELNSLKAILANGSQRNVIVNFEKTLPSI